MTPRRRQFHPHRRQRGFTLIEILMATLAFAVLMAALNTVLFSALRLRREAGQRIDDVDLRRQVRQVIERDLRNGILTSGLLAGTLLGTTSSEGGGRADRIEFYTTTATVNDEQPWGEIQRVTYFTDSDTGYASTNTTGRTLLRSVSRNLLAEEDDEDLVTTPLLRDVESFELTYFDGSSWTESWDSTTLDNAPPTAVRVRVRFVDDPWRDWSAHPIELLVPWTAIPRAAEEEVAEESSDSSDGDGGGDGGGGGGGTQPPAGGGGRG